VNAAALASELLLRRRARESAGAFYRAMRPEFVANWHTDLINSTLDRVLSREITRLILSVPPRHGKTETTSICFPAYALGRNPNELILATSYTADLATKNNKKVQRLMASSRYSSVFPETKLPPLYGKRDGYTRNTDFFEVMGGSGAYRSAGVGGSITGMGFTIGIIDDPIKGRAEAESDRIRDGIWEWYTNDFKTRAQRGAVEIVIMTRWHEDDLAGRLLNSAGGGAWHYLKLPAIAEGDLVPGDPRAEGEPIWPWFMGLDKLEAQRAEMGDYAFGALYQQSPSPRGGGLFKVDRMQFEPMTMPPPKMVRYYDLAVTTHSRSDYTASVALGMDNGRVVVWDAWRARRPLPELLTEIVRQAQIDGRGVPIVLEAEKAGQVAADYLLRMPELSGYAVRLDTPRGDKYSRAMPVASRLEAGLVVLRQAPWNRDFVEELRGFPNAQHDDQVDALSGAYNFASQGVNTSWQLVY
jgi:predicted phage terminase large subunit-like protein